MEELLAYAILVCEGIAPEDSYRQQLDLLFLENPENEILLALEWETDFKRAGSYIRTHFDYRSLSWERFGKIFMGKLSEYYDSCQDLKLFAAKMYSLWGCLPDAILYKMPFYILSFGEDPLSLEEEEPQFLEEEEPLSWEVDVLQSRQKEEQTKRLYEGMLGYYED